MSDEQEKTEQAEATDSSADQDKSKQDKPAGGGLPGIGAKPAGGGLPGLGAKPMGGGLPGLGAKPMGGGLPGLGAKPTGGGLPGMGAKPAGGGLPGMGAKPMGGGLPVGGAGAPVPDFIKKQQEQERLASLARDPFAAENAPAASFAQEVDEFAHLANAVEPGVSVGSNKKMYIIVAAVIGFLFMGVGYAAGLAVNQRALLNKVLGDAWIIQYEMKKLRSLHGEIQGMVNTALADANQRKYNKDHIAFLGEKLKGNPFNARIFTDRNYKTLNPLVVQMMGNLFTNWDKLANQVAEHKSKTINDEKVLTAAGEEFTKLLTTNYGVIFSRDEKAGGQFLADIVVLGASEGNSVHIQSSPGSYAEATREIYNPAEADDKLAAEPEKYAVVLGPTSKKTILQNATQSHFIEYQARLAALSKLLKVMEEEQQNMFNPLDDNCSREPVSFLALGVDPQEMLDDYIENDKTGANAVAEEPAAE
ncbi:MAG: hypothetical protein JXR91_12710 [Deltaproteobacteria bacterium]|nr:hypothetical protein [Deltaproteobacteria bacterium]